MKLSLRAMLSATAAFISMAAYGHAFLDHADPRVGSVVQRAPTELRIWFTQELEPAFSTVEVTDSSGKRVDAARARVDAHDPLLLEAELPKLLPGEYTVAWRAVSVDTHVTEGHFTFKVAP
jgi:copper resistance protein C